MSLDSLVESLKRLVDTMNKHGDLLRRSEALTRYALIDPLLMLMGWDVHDPEQVRAEYGVAGGAVDYALLRSSKPLFFVEAKALGGDLIAGTVQNINYCLQAGTPYLVVTDGRYWAIYNTHMPVPLAEKKVLSFDLADPDQRTVLVKALFLWHPVAPVVVPQPVGQPSQVVAPAARVSPAPPPSPPPPLAGATPLTQVAVKSKDKPPKALVLPDGTRKPLTSWKDLFVEAASYLHSKGALSATTCPVKKPGAVRYLVDISPKHGQGKQFREPRQVGNLWLETHDSAAQLLSDAVFLIQHLGENPDSFAVEF